MQDDPTIPLITSSAVGVARGLWPRGLVFSVISCPLLPEKTKKNNKKRAVRTKTSPMGDYIISDK